MPLQHTRLCMPQLKASMWYRLCHCFSLGCSSEQGSVTLLQPRGECVCESWPVPICLCSGGGESCACFDSLLSAACLVSGLSAHLIHVCFCCGSLIGSALRICGVLMGQKTALPAGHAPETL